MAKKSKPKREGCPEGLVRKAKKCVFLPLEKYKEVSKKLSNQIIEMNETLKKGQAELDKAQKELEEHTKSWEKKLKGLVRK